MSLNNEKKEASWYSKKVARILLEIEAVKIKSTNPFIWASGYRMPLYNDNRLLLRKFSYRKLISQGFINLISTEKIKFDVVAGTAIAGIPHAITLGNDLKIPVIYVREKRKDHGMKKQIEGTLLEGEKVIVIEDLVSTGGSLLRTVNTIRENGGIVNYCLSIFNYGFTKTQADFQKNECKLLTILDYVTLLKIAINKNYIRESELKILEEWQNSPFEWGEKHGFKRINRS